MAFAFLIDILSGAAISLMITCNAALASRTSLGVSSIINQSTGFLTLWMVMALTKHNKTLNPKRLPAPWYYWFSGIFGIALIVIGHIGPVILHTGKTGAGDVDIELVFMPVAQPCLYGFRTFGHAELVDIDIPAAFEIVCILFQEILRDLSCIAAVAPDELEML